MTKHTILFLAANPVGTDRLALDEEARAIRVALERSSHRDQFQLEMRVAARPLDLLDELRRLEPSIVHFSGHGGGGADASGSTASPFRDIVGESEARESCYRDGLFFQGPDGRPQLVSSAAVAKTFGAAGNSVQLVVLNACYSEAQAEALLPHVYCVVGVSGSIGDQAAQSFAVGFYGGLGEGQTVAAAYEQGLAAIELKGLLDGAKPRLAVRSHVYTHLALAHDPRSPLEGSAIHQEIARPIHSRIVVMFGILALVAIAAGIVAIALAAQSPSELVAFGIRLRTDSVGVGCIGLGLIVAFLTMRSVLKSQRDLAGLPPDDAYMTAFRKKRGRGTHSRTRRKK